MYLGKTLFARAMDFLPWKTFHRIGNRYGGDHRTRSLSCAKQFRVMACAIRSRAFLTPIPSHRGIHQKIIQIGMISTMINAIIHSIVLSCV